MNRIKRATVSAQRYIRVYRRRRVIDVDVIILDTVRRESTVTVNNRRPTCKHWLLVVGVENRTRTRTQRRVKSVVFQQFGNGVGGCVVARKFQQVVE